MQQQFDIYNEAASIIQKFFRNKLHAREIQIERSIGSDMYVNSDSEMNHVHRSKAKQYSYDITPSNKRDYSDDQINKKQSSQQFYGDDISDKEKIVLCSVISSVRQDDSYRNN